MVNNHLKVVSVCAVLADLTLNHISGTVQLCKSLTACTLMQSVHILCDQPVQLRCVRGVRGVSQGCVTWGVSGDVSGMCQVCERCVRGERCVSGVCLGYDRGV